MGRVGHLAGGLAGALILASASVAQAQTESQSQDASPHLTIFGWTISARASVQVSPDYLGSKSYSTGPTLSLQFHRPGRQSSFHGADDSPDLQLVGDKTFSGGLVVRGRSSRDDDGDLKGVHKVDFALEPGVYAEWWPTDGLRLRGEARRGATGNSAWSGDVAADAVRDDGRWVLSIGPRLHLGDSRFTRTYFDITALDAARSPSGISAYGKDGTFVSWGAVASGEYRWSPRWSLLGDVRYERLTGDAADSPIVAQLGSPNQVRAAVGVRYRFGR